MNKRLSLLLLFVSIISFATAQTLTTEENKLYSLIIQYRKENNLPSIPISKSLTTVAHTHVTDLIDNKPDRGDCNMHSWSSKGSWTACCYTDDQAKATCMWAKPGELTSYQGQGYEIAFGSSENTGYVMTAAGALESWKTSPGHNMVILETDIWANSNWKAIGIGMNGSFAVVWFGVEEDK